MTLDISTQDRPTTHYVGIPVTARYSEFGAPDGPNDMVPRVFQWLAEHQIVPQSGPLFVYRHVGGPEDPVDLTVAVPVAEPVTPTNGLVLGSLPAGTYIVGRYEGAPDEIPAADAEVRTWAETHGHRLEAARDDHGTPWTGHAEHYLTDPAEEPDTSRWVTELLYATA